MDGWTDDSMDGYIERSNHLLQISLCLKYSTNFKFH